MFDGIKPTRLWHHTGYKHFMRMLGCRLTADPCRVYSQRARPDLLMLHFLVFSSVMGLAYSFGLMSPPRSCKKPEQTYTASTNVKCNSDPCPSDQQPKRPKPCPPADD